MAGAGGSYRDVGFGEDVLMDILSRLPVKSLLQFKCVCKFWYALIKSPYFITKHLQPNLTTSLEGNAPLFGVGVARYYENNIEAKSSSLSKKDKEEKKNGKPTCKSTILWISNETTTKLLDDYHEVPSIDPNFLPFSNGGNAIPFTILGPVNGLYCAILNYKECRMYLCNPALREVKLIPEIPIPPLVPLMTQDPSLRKPQVIKKFGFGYDSKANDYKVVTITSISEYVQPLQPLHISVFVYTLRSNSWREIEYDREIFVDRPWREPSFTSHGNGGVAHWLVLDRHAECYHVIVSFDFVQEVFRKSNLPGTYVINYKPDVIREVYIASREYYIAVLNDDSIVLIISSMISPNDETNRMGKCWETWVMKEDGVKESWTKLFSNENLPGLSRLVGFHKNSGEALFTTLDHKLVSYNPISQQVKTLHNSFINITQVCTYMESLVSINGGGHSAFGMDTLVTH